MSRFSLLLALAFLGLSMASAQSLITVCPDSTCSGMESTDPALQCSSRQINATIDTCTQDVYGTNTGYAKVYCSNNEAHIALFGDDATCQDSSLQKVVTQTAGQCIQSTVFDCTGIEDTPLPSQYTAVDHISQRVCEDAGCQDACATVRIPVGACAQGLEGTDASKFSLCQNVDGQWHTTEETWFSFQGAAALTCPVSPAANATNARPYNECHDYNGPARYGNYVSYGCGNQDLSAAAFTAPAFTLLAALAAAMLAMVRMQ